MATPSNCILADMIFSIHFPNVLSKVIDLYDFGVSYAGFPGLGRMTVIETLNSSGHTPIYRHALADLHIWIYPDELPVAPCDMVGP